MVPITTSIQIAEPDLSGNEAKYLQECVATNFVSSVGPFVERFEVLVAAAAGNAHCVATSSGTAALHAGLTAVGVGRDDLVAMPGYTFIASANAISQCGAEPWLFDISRDTWSLDPSILEHQLATACDTEGRSVIHKATGRRVAALMPVHTLGIPGDMDQIVSIARRFDLPVVADSAAALGATDDGRPIGKLGADLTVLSFNGNKTVTAGGGGALCGDDGSLIDRVRHLTMTARNGPGYDHDRVGFNYRMTNLSAAVGCAQMERLQALLAAKRRIRDAYDAAIDGLSGLTPFVTPPNVTSSNWLSGVVGADIELVVRLRAALEEIGVASRPFWKPVHLQKPYRDVPTTAQSVSEDLWQRIVILPSSVSLREEDQARVIKCLETVTVAT